MSSSDVAIRVENVSKHYLMFARPEDRLKQMVVPKLQRLAGRAPKQFYRDFAALTGISFEVKRGETVGIIGRNGCGKSTLLQIVCGTLQPTTGSVTVNGRIAALLELGAGFNPEFTGRENVYLNAAILGLARAEIDARFDAIAAFADIGQFIDQPVKTYSSGMYVRLAFAVAINVEPDILVVDRRWPSGTRPSSVNALHGSKTSRPRAERSCSSRTAPRPSCNCATAPFCWTAARSCWMGGQRRW